VLQTLLYLNTSDLQYSLCTVLLTVPLAALNVKLVTELVAVTDLTLSKSHRIQGTELLMTLVELSADSVLCCFVITYSSAEWNRKL